MYECSTVCHEYCFRISSEKDDALLQCQAKMKSFSYHAEVNEVNECEIEFEATEFRFVKDEPISKMFELPADVGYLTVEGLREISVIAEFQDVVINNGGLSEDFIQAAIEEHKITGSPILIKCVFIFPVFHSNYSDACKHLVTNQMKKNNRNSLFKGV